MAKRIQYKKVILFIALIIIGSLFLGITNIYGETIVNSIEEVKLENRNVNSLKFSWNEINNAKYYEIYRLNSKTNKYEKIGTTKSNVYEDNNLVSATNYYYKVKPRGNDLDGYSNKFKFTTRPLRPKVNLQSKSQSVKVNWTGTSSRSSGYEVYICKSDNGEYKLIGETTEKTFTYENINENETYYVKVRAYRTVDGEKIYSLYSKVNSIRGNNVTTNISGLSTSLCKIAGTTLYDTIKVSPANGRKIYLQMYNNINKIWETKKTYRTDDVDADYVKLIYPKEWYEQVYSKWRVYIPSTNENSSYTSPTITIKAKRVYENPTGYIQLKEKVTVSGGGKDLVKGTMGLRVAKVQRRLGMGHVWEVMGPSTISKVMAFQKTKGLKVTGTVNLSTWKKMGFSESSWYTLDTYVTPVKAELTDTRADLIEKMISTAKSYLGTEYVVGAAGVPGSGIDCSGLVMQAMYSIGIDPSPVSVTRHTRPGYEYECRNIWNLSTLKTVSKPKKGDLVFYKNSSGEIIHVAIYLGNGKVIESWPEKVVEWPLTNSHRALIKGYKRILR